MEQLDAMQQRLAEKLEKKKAEKEAKKKEDRQFKAEMEIRAVEAKRFQKEMDREDPKVVEMMGQISEEELEKNAESFLQEYLALLAQRQASTKKTKAAESAAKVALIPNPRRDWKCNGCTRINTVDPAAVKPRKKGVKAKMKRSKDDDDDDDETEESAEPEVTEQYSAEIKGTKNNLRS
jgi:Zn-dependent metalloprotease